MDALSTSTSPSPIPLSSQVGGHKGVMTTEDGSLIIKPCLPLEREFYQMVRAADERVKYLLPFVPTFYGTLNLLGKTSDGAEGGVEKAQSVVNASASGGVDVEELTNAVRDSLKIEPAPSGQARESIVLENATHGFIKPNVIDIKLGTVLYDEDASLEKKQRMIKRAKETTSLQTGLRVTGFQIHKNATSESIVVGKDYGYSLRPSQLPDSFRRFFPVSKTSHNSNAKMQNPIRPGPPSESEPDAEMLPPSTSDSGTQTADDDTGLPADHLLPVLECILNDIMDLRDAIESCEIRMVGSSLLIAYEADAERLRNVLFEDEEDQAKTKEKEKNALIEAMDDNKPRKKIKVDNINDDDNDDDDDDDDNESSKADETPPFVVRLIDFAHTRLADDQGPDFRVLKGLDTAIKLLQGRIKEVERILDEDA